MLEIHGDINFLIVSEVKLCLFKFIYIYYFRKTNK